MFENFRENRREALISHARSDLNRFIIEGNHPPDYFRTTPRFPKPDKIQSIKKTLIQFCEDILTE